MGERTDEFLAKAFQDSFKRETDADEAIWRSLPFFLALLGLAISGVPTIVQGVSGHTHGGWAYAAWTLLGAAALLFAFSGWAFWRVIKLRKYRYPSYDREFLTYSMGITEFYLSQGMTEMEVDATVHAEVRRTFLEELAAASTENRINNEAKAKARSQVLLSATAGFLLAFLAEVVVLAAQVLA